MPTCSNCESFVSKEYVRVFAPTSVDGVRVCPQCEDLVREGGEVRERRP